MGTDIQPKTSCDFKLIHMNLTCHDDVILRISASFLQLIFYYGINGQALALKLEKSSSSTAIMKYEL